MKGLPILGGGRGVGCRFPFLISFVFYYRTHL
jgi:hypothetical protein